MKPFLIAEIGINHNGDLNIAKQLIDLAVKCKWDAVKFQKRNVDKIFSSDSHTYPRRETPWGVLSYLDYKKRIEFGKEEFDEIDRYCREVGIDWFASSWDVDSVKFLEQYDLKYNKIASAMITNIDVLREVAKQRKMTFISTGMSEISDIDIAHNIFIENKCPHVIMHCVGEYPCPPERLNLNAIKTLKNRYNTRIGYSGHSPGALDSIVATVLGADYIEKHITLDRSMWGTDQSSSIEKRGMEYIRQNCDEMRLFLGDGRICMTEDEKKVAKKLRYWE